MKPVVLTRDQWRLLREKLRNDYPPSVMLMRSKMRDVLGFTDRSHTNWDTGNLETVTKIHLDFFDESKRTFFLLKYSEYISRTNTGN